MNPRHHLHLFIVGMAAPWLVAPAGAAQLNISQQPLFLTQTVAPNLILTMDNSNSMKWAFVPDVTGYESTRVRNTRRAKSASYNPMYYNPDIDYQVPKKVEFVNGALRVSDYRISDSDQFNFRRVQVNGFSGMRGAVDLSSDYRVSWQYDPTGGQATNFNSSTNYGGSTGRIYHLAENPAADFKTGGWRPDDRTRKGVPAYYYRYDPSLQKNCRLDNDNCYRLVNVSASSGPGGRDERRNFAIWYAFYRNRALATQSAANLAFNSLPESVRLTWQDLSNCTTLDASRGCNGVSYSGSNQFRPFASQGRANFFRWLGDINYNTATPLRVALDRAGKFIAKRDGPAYDFQPGGQKQPQFACRPSYHLMMTDGKWNGGEGSRVGNLDGGNVTLPDGRRYAPLAPYRDGAGNTLADLAFYYWANDARKDIPNQLAPHIAAADADATRQYWDPRNNPATWQHLVTFTMGLGLGRALEKPQWAGSTFEGPGYQGLLDGSIAWPAAAADSDNNVYDLWHAAINSRGEFFSAEDPQQMIDAFASILSRIASRTASAARPAVAAGEVKDQAHVYAASFSSEDWSGDLVKYRQLADGRREALWSAKGLLDARTAPRRVLMRKGGALAEFTWANLDASQKAALNRTLSGDKDTLGEARLGFLRGKRDLEGGTFRTRGALLGDIVNSAPLLVAAPSRPAHARDSLEAPGAYSEFKAAQAAREAVVYVGANDGMLHAFDAEAGEELFAFVPSAVVGNLHRLADPRYGSTEHRYFVDGPLVAEDVFFDGAWRTVLVGGLGAGGRALFALDVTEPRAPKLLWEIEGGAGPFARLGHSLPRPAIVRLASGRWAVLAANGYDSVQDMAVLYLIDIGSGELIRELNVSKGGDAANGLSSPRAADMDGDGIVDYAYAGDLLGNLWRFDLHGAGGEAVGLAGRPLFQARDARQKVQPISATPWLVRHPSGQGVLALLGTGKYFEVNDAQADTSKAMSLYGIWDRQVAGEPADGASTVQRGHLQVQQIEDDGDGYRTLSDEPLAWAPATQKPGASGTGRHGWLLDLPMTGERVVADPAGSGRLALFSTLTPNVDPCSDGVSTWLMALNPLTGGAPLADALDYDRNGVIDDRDREGGAKVAGLQFPGLGGTTIGFDLDSGLGLAHGSEGSLRFFDGIRPGRQSWRMMRVEQ
ncbi:PilC/PilY family type IV pilus protein [Pseudomonas sp. JH-2]|uniref:pilus assembly protein n=1 Tax=Pseudomonas sp. JH-2 TaxID=3114998 RepID=UPI002E253503|nr:PilC/PilY family type IV pilus protein [Pseudomonas sp. JH-2]